MLRHVSRIASIVVLVGLCVYCSDDSPSQEPPPYRPDAPAQAPGELPRGVEVQARGPIHEAFASPSVEPKPTPMVNRKPPVPIDEMPPDERPDGDASWIGGYWAFDDDRADYIWVSGCWRIKPANKEWVPGYWREVGTQWQWAPGFWTSVSQGKTEQVTYYPEPPAPPAVAPPGEPPAADTFYLPGYWTWNGDRYVWRAGYWTRVRPGYVYVAAHYRWTPQGYILVPGYWDLAVSRRGVLYAPVYVDPVVVGPRYVYTPYFAVRDNLVLDTMFIRPVCCSYYFGDYYGPRYVGFGFEPVVVYSRRCYEPIIVYERWNYRDNPRWFDIQLTLVVDRNAGRVPLPPRVITRENIVQVNVMFGPTRTILAARGERVVALDMAARGRLREATVVHREAMAAERRRMESGPAVAHDRPHAAAFNGPVHPTGGAAAITHPTGNPNPMVTHPTPPPNKGPVRPPPKKDEKKKTER
jgi:hypothetical protein